MELAAQTRTVFGKATKALKKQGLIPAELYGHGVENLHLSIPEKDFKKAFREAGENTVLSIVVGGEKHSALVHEVSHDYITGVVTHIDFRQVRMDEKIKAHIPLEFIGEAPAVKAFSGILNKTISEIEVEALPADLPHRFTVDVSLLAELNQSIYVRDLVVPKGVKILVDAGTALASVTPPMKEEEIAPVAVDLSEVKVESEEKKAARDKEKEEKKEE